jgi:adenylate cyclase
MESRSVERKLTAILSADVQGYSRLMGEDEVGTLRTLTACREVTDSFIQQHRGRIVGTAGDSVLAEFASVVDAVQCAVEIQGELKARNSELPSHRRMQFRIGINLGDVIVQGEQIYGDGVNIAARLESLADGGGICISGTVHEHIKNKLLLEYEDLGEQTVKNIAEPVRVWRIKMEPEEARSPRSEVRSPESKGDRHKPYRVGITYRHWAMVAGLLLIAGTIVAVRYFSRPPLNPQSSALITQEAQPPLPLPDKPSIVVLPFVNMSEDSKQEYFSDGLTEDLTTDLSKISSLFVIARNSAFTYKGKAVKVEEVGRELGVRYVLEGSVRKVNDQVRITTQLVDASTGYHLWSERYDRDLKDIFALQDEIRQKIVLALKVKLTPEEQERFRHYPTDNLEAYDYFLRGGESLLRFTKEAHAQARQMFEKAIELDPKYAAAYAGLSIICSWEWLVQWTQDPQSLEQAFELAQQAVALDDSLPMAHRQLGFAYLSKGQYEQAIAEGERAIALDPNCALCHGELGNFLNFAGRPEEAIGLVEKAIRLDPKMATYYSHWLGRAYRLMGRYEEAIAAFKKTLSVYPRLPGPRADLVVIYSQLGREEEARAEVTEILRISPDFSLEGVRQRWFYKDPAESERYLTALRKAGLK